MTQGILSPDTYYYRRVFIDAVRAIQAARSHPQVDKDRVVCSGGSQGGGLSIAVAGWFQIWLVLCRMSFLCHFKRAVTLTDERPYSEISHFLKTHRDKIETVFNTLSYFDGMNFAVRAKPPALFSVGLMDTTCRPQQFLRPTITTLAEKRYGRMNSTCMKVANLIRILKN